ncbi:indolepyruvate ferredoxin oxidoreductase family protein, partial [Bordetella pertussis]
MNAPLTPAQRAALESVHLDDKYTLTAGRAWMSGIHALVRLPMMQRVRDERAGLNTAGFVSGYRGSPLGGVDQNMWKAAKYLKQHHIEFQPGINEDLAATAVWGSQQVNLFPGAKYDGVFGMWYGKGPGVDRCGDVFKHANVAGTSRHGGVLVVAGDDHPAKSSTLPHQSDHILKVCMIPALFPASVQEVLDYGLHGWAMSRYAGVWVGMKCITDIVEVSASVEVDPERTRIVLPEDFQLPPDGLNIRLPDTPLQQEARLLDYKLYAALAYARANRLNREMWQVPNAQARFGIMTSGKAYLDTRQALADLGLSEEICKRIGLRLFKVGMVWPLEATGMQRFAEDLDEILVVEEKRQVLEYQLKEELFSWIGTGKKIPRVVGKFDDKDGGEWSVPQGNWLLPAHYEFSPAMVAKAIGARLLRFELPEDVRAGIQARLDFIAEREQALARPRLVVDRKPWFCSGCPHNTSTRVPEGSRGMAGIGCHYMVTWMGRNTQVFTQMGGEGVPWVGQAPFTEEKHVFANLGDCTYYHSGLLAIRAAVAAKVPITYKILFNDAVAMTSGQPVDGPISVPMITRQMAAEGIEKIVVVTDEPEKYRHVTDLAPGVPVKHRDELDAVMKELRAYPDVSVLVYDQTCATEKRRRRKRNAYPDPALRVVINERVCEGCGDCSEKSHCLSVEPLETEFGRKRTINQSSCNKDYSCLKGFCPSFVTVEGGRLRKPRALAQQDAIDQGGPAGA